MSTQPKLFMPLIPPPEIDQSDPAGFYTTLNAQISIDAPASGTGLQVTIENPNDLLPASQFSAPRPLSTVYGIARGFVSFYPSGVNLPTPDGQPMTVPPEMAGLDIGTVIQQVWFADYRKLGNTVSPPEIRTTHIAYMGLDRLSVENAFRQLLLSLPTKALVKSWKEKGGSGPVPDRATLENDYLQRAMSGDGSIYIASGSPLGTAAKVSIIPSTGGAPVTVGRFVLQTYYVSTQAAQSSFTDAESVIDGIFDLQDGGGVNLYSGHPLIEANDAVGSVQFHSIFQIWNNVTHDYQTLSGCGVRLHKVNGKTDTVVASTTTATDGKINISANLARCDKIQFEADLVTYGNPIGNRTFSTNLKTELERAGKRLHNTKTNAYIYQLKYRVAKGDKGYRAFYDELRKNEKHEKYEKDRGTAETDNWLHLSSAFTNKLLDLMDEFEDYYAGGAPDAGAFNVLFEGDSWLSYPIHPTIPNDTSIFSHLDDALAARLGGLGLSYNRVPLQHHGDRSDQMFGKPTAITSTQVQWPVQWDYTQDFLKEYKFDLIILSAGGNDFAEPGMSNHLPGPLPIVGWILDFDKGGREVYPSAYIGNVFNPDADGSQFSQDTLAMFRSKLQISCAALLRNHRWNLKLHKLTIQDSTATVKSTLDPLLTALGLDTTQMPATVGDNDVDVKTAGIDVINRFANKPLTFPDRATPGSATDDYNKLLQIVFDETFVLQRYAAVKANLEALLIYAQSKNIQVLTHTYCYPIFKEKPTTMLGGTIHIAGPWFEPRFTEAKIESRYVRMICLKAMIDNYVRLVLDPLKEKYSCFDYVDVRTMNRDPALWNDEMHLTDSGFAAVAQTIFDYATNTGMIPGP